MYSSSKQQYVCISSLIKDQNLYLNFETIILNYGVLSLRNLRQTYFGVFSLQMDPWIPCLEISEGEFRSDNIN